MAVLTAALLQLVVFLPPGSVSWHWTIGVIAAGFSAVAFIFLGGWDWTSDHYTEWSIRRHIRKHPGLVGELLSLLEQHGQVFGSGNWFLNSGNSIISNWMQINGQNPSPFNQQQRDSAAQAHASLTAWSNSSAYWSYVKATLEWRIRHRGSVDSYEFYWAAKMVGVEIARGVNAASTFVQFIRSAGVDRLPNYNADRWDDFRNRADSLIRLAHEIDRKAKLLLEFDVGLTFAFVPQLYPRPGEPAPTPQAPLAPVAPPSEPQLGGNPPPTPTARRAPPASPPDQGPAV